MNSFIVRYCYSQYNTQMSLQLSDESLMICEVYAWMTKHGIQGVFIHVECD